MLQDDIKAVSRKRLHVDEVLDFSEIKELARAAGVNPFQDTLIGMYAKLKGYTKKTINIDNKRYTIYIK